MGVWLKIRSASLLRDQAGSIISIELLLVATVLLLGVATGLASTRDSIVSEVSDLADSVQDFNQSFTVNGVTGPAAVTAGFGYSLDNVDDPAGLGNSCISFDVDPLDEAGTQLATFVLSNSGTFGFDNVVTGVGGSATGTIGDGTIDTGFTITTDTADIAGTTGGTELRFRETPQSSGSFTITYDEPVTEFEFFVRSLANIAGELENLLGNFMLTLSDGTVVNDAPFQIVPDVIAPNQNFGEFETRNTDLSPLSVVTRDGATFVTDPVFDGTPNQAAGRLVFPDIPSVGDPAVQGAVGLKALTFERSGGNTSNSFQATFSTSGRVLRQTSP